MLEFDMTLRQAVDAPRMHHQWLPDRLQVEAALMAEHPKVIEALEKRAPGDEGAGAEGCALDLAGAADEDVPGGA
jgi:gamma-glutamyltranspeptidase